MKKYEDIINKCIDNFTDLLLNWTTHEIGNFDKWFGLLKNVIIFINKLNTSLTEIEISEISVKVVIELSTMLYKKKTDTLTEEEIIDLKSGDLKVLCIIMENPDILKTGTSLFNDLLNKMDSNKDGKVSFKEFCKFICPC